VESVYRRPLFALVLGLALSTLGPAVGWLATVLSLRQAFDAVANAEPSTKARLLSEGISGAMSATAVGLGVGILGVLVVLIAASLLVRASLAARAGPAVPRREPPG
jgi:biopolymer transport protein ExbB/TolQ